MLKKRWCVAFYFYNQCTKYKNTLLYDSSTLFHSASPVFQGPWFLYRHLKNINTYPCKYWCPVFMVWTLPICWSWLVPALSDHERSSVCGQGHMLPAAHKYLPVLSLPWESLKICEALQIPTKIKIIVIILWVRKTGILNTTVQV